MSSTGYDSEEARGAVLAGMVITGPSLVQTFEC